LQHSDERPPTSGRPSLLSLDQQAEADRHRILSGLENKPAASLGGKEKSRKGMVAWIAAGAAVLALSAGAGMWLVSEGEKEIVLAGTAPLPATPAPAAALATEAPMVRGTADDVSSAAILNDAPLIKSEPVAAADKKQADDELTKMLEHGTPAAESKAAPVAPRAPARPVKPVRVAAKAPVKKPVVAPREQASNVAPRPRVVAAPAKKKAEAKVAAPVDNDVALLAALVAHSKATQPKSTGAAAKLRQCKSLDSVAEANQCRARVCAGAKSAPECKSSSLGKAASEG
jgi:hypothetical protein